jgi:peroxiredoxin Q/BCP
VVGVSYDTVEKHAKFAETYNLPYPLVSDADATIAGKYGVARLGGWLPTRRVTFVIDKSGVVRKTIESELNVDKHIDEAMAALKEMS